MYVCLRESTKTRSFGAPWKTTDSYLVSEICIYIISSIENSYLPIQERLYIKTKSKHAMYKPI